jgi:hypothetical protein
MKLRIDGWKCVCVLERERGKEKKKPIYFTVYMNSVGDVLNPKNFIIENNSLLDCVMKWVG